MTEKMFYKALTIQGGHSSYRTGEIVYLFKVGDGKPFKTMWISAYRDRNGDDFIVESGAGTSEKRMESQIKKYLGKRLKNKGFI